MSGATIKSFKVRIGGPAKLGELWLKPGDEPEVTEEERSALQAAGLLLPNVTEPGAEAPSAPLPEAGTEPIDLEAKARELAAAMFDGELARLEAEVKSIMAASEAEVAAANARATSAEKALSDHIAQTQADVSRIQLRNAELEATIAALTPPPGEKRGTEASDADFAQSSAPAGEAGAANGSNTSPPGGAAAPADKDTPPTAKVAKTAQKKGAAAAPKG